ncbi:MAG: hydrogenase nickel incorporation protein HypB [Firmicutes bacterium]|nr:hydrogenase nickel incorporation protein HypB [Bacillota bacterium]
MNYDILETKERVLADNEQAAKDLRVFMEEKHILFINLMASPGAGKTTLLKRTIEALKDEYRIAVMEADVDSDVDARAISALGAKVIQLHSGGLCHMDADMTARGANAMDLEDVDILFLENIGNLVCPAEFDVGATRRVMILSVPEGDDKPLKYPLMFQVSDVLLINKIDTLPIFDFSKESLEKNVALRHEGMPILYLSAKTGEGMDGWISYLKSLAAKICRGADQQDEAVSVQKGGRA